MFSLWCEQDNHCKHRIVLVIKNNKHRTVPTTVCLLYDLRVKGALSCKGCSLFDVSKTTIASTGLC